MYTAVNCGLHTQVFILVVHIAHGQIHTFTPFAPALIKLRVALSVITFPAISVGLSPNIFLNFLIFSIMDF